MKKKPPKPLVKRHEIDDIEEWMIGQPSPQPEKSKRTRVRKGQAAERNEGHRDS